MSVMNVDNQVPELLRLVDDARQARQGEYVRLLSELTPRLQAARKAERERDEQAALEDVERDLGQHA